MPYPVLTSPGKVSKWKRLVARDGAFCAHCGSESNLTLDHILPRCRGGGGELANLQILCEPCNAEKGASHIDYRARLVAT